MAKLNDSESYAEQVMFWPDVSSNSSEDEYEISDEEGSRGHHDLVVEAQLEGLPQATP